MELSTPRKMRLLRIDTNLDLVQMHSPPPIEEEEHLKTSTVYTFMWN